MLYPKDNFVDVEKFNYIHFDDRYSECEVCGFFHDVSLTTGIDEHECLCCVQDDEIPDGRGNKERWEQIVKETGMCPYCPPHSGDNHSRKCRDDKHKNKRR